MNMTQSEHEHHYDIHYTAVDWQNPIFIKCLECGSTFKLIRHPVLAAIERLADTAEDLLFHLPTQSEWDALRHAWQAYVEVAPEESPDTTHRGSTAN